MLVIKPKIWLSGRKHSVRSRPYFSFVMQRPRCCSIKAMACRQMARPSYTYTREVAVVPEVHRAMRSAQQGLKSLLYAPEVNSPGRRWAISGSASRRLPMITAPAPAWESRWVSPASLRVGSSSRGFLPAASRPQNRMGQSTQVSRHRPTQPSRRPRRASSIRAAACRARA